MKSFHEMKRDVGMAKTNLTRKGLESYVTRCACKDVGIGLHMTLDPSLFTSFLLIYHPYIPLHFVSVIRACAIKTTPINLPNNNGVTFEGCQALGDFCLDSL